MTDASMTHLNPRRETMWLCRNEPQYEHENYAHLSEIEPVLHVHHRGNGETMRYYTTQGLSMPSMNYLVEPGECIQLSVQLFKHVPLGEFPVEDAKT